MIYIFFAFEDALSYIINVTAISREDITFVRYYH